MEWVEGFLKEPVPEKLELLSKGELTEIGEKLEFGVKRSMRKNEMKQRRINRKGHRNEVNESMDSYQ